MRMKRLPPLTESAFEAHTQFHNPNKYLYTGNCQTQKYMKPFTTLQYSIHIKNIPVGKNFDQSTNPQQNYRTSCINLRTKGVIIISATPAISAYIARCL